MTISGGNLTFVTTDRTTAVQAVFNSSSTIESCSGGGHGGHITCSYTFTGSFSGTLTVNGSTQAINGSTQQLSGTDGLVVDGATGYNSAYTPFYFSNSGQLLRADDLNGDNLISYGTQGRGLVTVGTTTSAKTVTLTNRQTVALTFSSIGVSAGFHVASNTCGTSIAAGANCSIGVTFSPTASGSITGTLTFVDSAGNSPQVVNLSGAGQ